MVELTQFWLCQHPDSEQSAPGAGGSAQVPQALFFVPWQYWLAHWPLNAQPAPFVRPPVATQSAGGLLSKKSMQAYVVKSATHFSTPAGVDPVCAAARPFSQDSVSREMQVAMSPYMWITLAPGPLPPARDEHIDRSAQRAAARSVQAWAAVRASAPPSLFAAEPPLQPPRPIEAAAAASITFVESLFHIGLGHRPKPPPP
jgi:hypothetical protein